MSRRSYAELFTTTPFSHTIFVDQAPLQNYLSDWGPEYGNLGCNSTESLWQMQNTLLQNPATAHRGTIAACLAYRFSPLPGDPTPNSQTWIEDEEFFLGEALKGDGWWYGKLMADHTANDWRWAIKQNFGPGSGSRTKVLVVASRRSGCFPVGGVLKVVELVNGEEDNRVGENEGGGGSKGALARGVDVEWGGHWCYWENAEKFSELVDGFFSKE